ncbi:U3 snoRNP protein, partial [Mortierella sp. 14UC]
MQRRNEGPDKEDSKRPRYHLDTQELDHQMQAGLQKRVWDLKDMCLDSPAPEVYVRPRGYEKPIGVTQSHNSGALQLERNLWQACQCASDPVPILVKLSSISNPLSDLMEKVLKAKLYNDAEIYAFKTSNRQLVLICDEYDEIPATGNIYNNNKFNKPGEWRVKLIIACRSYKLGQDSDDQFQPLPDDRCAQTNPGLFQKVAMALFTRCMIEDYVEKYVAEPYRQDVSHPFGSGQSASRQLQLEVQESQPSTEVSRVWRAQDYMETLADIPNLMELVKNPYILSFVLGLLPTITSSTQDISRSRVSLDVLYKQILHQLMETSKRCLQSRNKSIEEIIVFEGLLEGFEGTCMEYQKGLSLMIFKTQRGDPIVRYCHPRDKDRTPWKTRYLGPHPESMLLQESAHLVRSGHYYRFFHWSVLQYLFSLEVFDPDDSGKDALSGNIPGGGGRSLGVPESDRSREGMQPKALDKKHKLGVANIATRSMVIQLLADRVQDNPVFIQQLIETVRESRNNLNTNQTLAANAMTILVRSGMRFNSADLQGIKIQGANMTGGEFDSADLRNADLRNTILDKCCLSGARLEGALLNEAKFGELPFIPLSGIPTTSAFSSDGKRYAVGFINESITVFDAFRWTVEYTCNASRKSITAIAFSPNDKLLAYGDMMGIVKTRENTININTALVSFQAHNDLIAGLVFSPDGNQIATASQDNKVGLWEAKSGRRVWSKRKRHLGASSVAFAPDGVLLASGGFDKAVRLGHQIVSASSDKTVRIWSVQTKVCESVLLGHSEHVTDVAYSPNGQQLVSCSEDSTVRTWDPLSGGTGPVYRGHTEQV